MAGKTSEHTSGVDHRGPLILAFTLSGAAGLILEVVWFEVLGATKTTGPHSIAGAAAVLTASYMAGLALGSHLAARLADRIRFRLWLYAIMELAVCLCALSMPPVLKALSPALGHSAWAWLAVAALLLVPTTAMGMGLPLLASSFTQSKQQGPSVAAFLYGMNTTGAVLGVVWAGLIGIPRLGVGGASFVASALLCIVVALVSVSAWLNGPQPRRDTPALRNDEGPGWSILVLAGAASGAAMVVQVAWTRLAANWVETPALGFSMTVLGFLLGLAFGAFLAARLLKRLVDLTATLRMILIGIGASLALALGIGLVLGPVVNGQAAPWLIVLPILPVTTGSGAVLPLFIALATRSGASVGAAVGNTGAASTVGAIFGSLLGGLLLPWVGAAFSVVGSLALYGMLAILVRKTIVA